MSTSHATLSMLMLIAWLALAFLAGGCAPSHLVVTRDPQLQGIRTVYVSRFDSLAPHPDAAIVMTAAPLLTLPGHTSPSSAPAPSPQLRRFSLPRSGTQRYPLPAPQVPNLANSPVTYMAG